MTPLTPLRVPRSRRTGWAAPSSRGTRAAALELALGPAFAAAYAALSWGDPGRVPMLAIAVALLAADAVAWAAAPRLPGPGAHRVVQAGGVLVNLVGCALVGLLDGGIASPFGALVYCTLPFVAMRFPTTVFVGAAVAAVAAYGFVAVVGDDSTPGFAVAYTLFFLALSLQGARHARWTEALDDRLAATARVDPLTGCLNRRGFDERLAQELARAQRSGRPVSLVLVDLDIFKSVNDRHGHDIGDGLLAWTGAALAAAARTEDAVGRLGGDEFAVLLRDAGPDEAAVVLQRLRTALADDAPASMGLATSPAEAATIDDLYRLADDRLYDDKRRRTSARPRLDRPVPVAPPPVPEVAAAPAGARRRARRRLLDMGIVTGTDFLIGLLYAAVFAAPDHRPQLLALLAVGLGAALVPLALARRALSLPAALAVMVLAGGIELVCTAVAAAIDGGIGSPLALALLAPLPLLALAFPPVPATLGLLPPVGAYVAVALTAGMPSGWFLATHLIGVIALSGLCMAQGRRAARKRALLLRLVRVDGLTGCLNRRGFDERVQAELASARRHGDPLSLLVLDLDGFKAHNDRHGHAAGDELLRWVADQLQGLVRSSELVGRLGGDEFAVVLPGCPADEAPLVAARAVDALASRIAVSVGTATFGLDGADFPALYRHADRALYAARRVRDAVATGGEAPLGGGPAASP